MPVPAATRNSWEDQLHTKLNGQNALLLSKELKTDARFELPLGHRAIGVGYRPQAEQFGNYVLSDVPERYDAFMFPDQTSALHPLAIQATESGPPDLYPWGE